MKHSPSMARFVALLLTGNHEQNRVACIKRRRGWPAFAGHDGLWFGSAGPPPGGVEPQETMSRQKSHASRKDVLVWTAPRHRVPDVGS